MLVPILPALVEQFAEERMAEIQREFEGAGAGFAMGHGELSGREPARQRQPEPTELQIVAGTAEGEVPFSTVNRSAIAIP